jgi:branched-subunit amino acid ABC-type transport system permease component
MSSPGAGTWDISPAFSMQVQAVIVNTLVWAAELGLIAIGMTLVYAILKFANFAQAEFATIGAYVTYSFHVRFGTSLILATIGSMVAVGLLAVTVNEVIFKRLRLASPVAKMVASVGIATAFRSTVSIVYGTRAVSLGYSAQRLPEVFGLQFTDVQIIIIISAIASMLLFNVAMKRTMFGKALRAVADNHSLAETKGIDTAYVTRWMWFISGSFAAMGGALIALETQLRPVLGQFIIMPMFAAATVGGLGSVYGAIAGALVMAVTQNIALGINFGPLVGQPLLLIKAGYKDAIALAVLVFTLLFKPEGILGTRTQ